MAQAEATEQYTVQLESETVWYSAGAIFVCLSVCSLLAVSVSLSVSVSVSVSASTTLLCHANQTRPNQKVKRHTINAKH